MKIKTIICGVAIAVLISSCQTPTSQIPATDLGFRDAFVSDVIGVSEKHLSPEHWIQPRMNEILLSPVEITTFNRDNIALDPTLYDVQAMPGNLRRSELKAYIRSISNPPKFARIFMDGSPLTDADVARYEISLNIGVIKDINPVRFGLAVRRTSIRTYPTNDLLFSEGASDRDIERFQESVLFPGNAVALLHESADGNWGLVQSYNYLAWVLLKDIAVGSRSEVFEYANPGKFLVITGDKVSTVYNPEQPQVSELQLDMGTKLPLSRPKDLAHNLYGQNPYLSHMVLLPVRLTNGTLEFKHALIQRKEDTHVGYLPFTQENIIRQSFKFLGERYGWGHRFNGRDCTGFVSEVYKTFGIMIPRNSGDQGRSSLGINSRYEEDVPRADKVERLKHGQPGDLIYIPGHVLMLLGQSDGQPFVIHDVHGLGLLKEDGSLYSGTLNGVSVTPMIPLQSNPDRSYLDRVYTIKTVKNKVRA